MSQHDDRLPLHEMLEHAREALEMIQGRERAEIRTNRMLQLSLNYLILSMGEAATRVSSAARARHPDVPFSKAVATRHFIAHGYDRIDYDVVWDTVASDFPPLVAALERVLREPG
jgi:uncharacterized protein with HEPN domain